MEAFVVSKFLRLNADNKIGLKPTFLAGADFVVDLDLALDLAALPFAVPVVAYKTLANYAESVKTILTFLATGFLA